MSEYKCESHKIDLVCLGCVKAWIARHDKLVEFVKSLMCQQDDVHTTECSKADDWGNMDLCELATDVLKEIGEL